jgi:hypothetical protein
VQRTLQRVLDDGNDTLKLFRGEVTGALAEIDIGLLADQVGVAATDTLDLGQGVHDLLFSIDVRVQQTDDVLEAGHLQSALFVDVIYCARIARIVLFVPQPSPIRYLPPSSGACCGQCLSCTGPTCRIAPTSTAIVEPPATIPACY